MRKRTIAGFTLMEIMIIFLIIGIFAAFAVPSYQKYLEKQKDKDVKIYLQTILAASKIYKAKHGEEPPFLQGLNEINNTLGTNIHSEDWTSWQFRNPCSSIGRVLVVRSDVSPSRIFTIDYSCTGSSDITCITGCL